ncbi:sugar phosphate isomerase/epimerase family protein [Paenibacillus cremeus]|nr:sugar phosphate isomerase/epimerase family protein [Paenibacillus cremeus]
MRIGWCASLKDAALIKQIGFDFIELPLAPFGLENPDTFAEAKRAVAASPLPTSAFNIFFPGQLKIVGPDTDPARIRNYIARAAELLTAAKAEIIVLGSGGARNVPENWERSHAEDQLVQVLNWCADELRGTGVTLAIEPLNRKESNIINSVAEGVHFAEAVNRPEIRVLADFYHMDEDQEPLQELLKHRDWLAHIHLADTGRRHPGSGSYDYNTFFGYLQEIGYDGMISAECKVEQPEEDMRSSLAFARPYWKAV